MPNLTASSFPESPRGVMTKAFLVIAAVGVIGGGSYLGWFAYDKHKTAQAQKVARTFVSDVTSGDAAHAYALTSVNVQRNSSQAQFEKDFSGLKATNPKMLQEAFVLTKAGADYQATLDGLPPTAEGRTTGSFAVRLVRSGGDWQVDSVGVE